jgi:superfamily I DNA/RNA helicase
VSSETPALPLTSVQRRVLEHVDNPVITSPEQTAAVKHDGDFFLSACPGAGKTQTVGLRLAYHAAFHPDISVAAASHTNTAIEAIQTAARELAPLPDHFWVGTLHAFLLRYVVYPFGALYMGCTDVPQVAADDRDWPDDIPDVAAHDDYAGCRVTAWKFDVHPGPRFTYQRPADWPPPLTEEIVVAGCAAWAKATKREYWKRGLLSFSDVLWVAFRVLERHPQLVKAVPRASTSSSSTRSRTRASCNSSASGSCGHNTRILGSSSSATYARPSTNGRVLRPRVCVASLPSSSSKSCV